MNKLTTNQIRQIWLDYFSNHQHMLFPSQSLIPVNDPSLLWINSGVATLKPYFSGIKNPPANRLTSSQKCIRTNDIFNVGVTSRHHTFFEMLGNFSIGDYFKKEAIHFAYDLLINNFKIDVNKLYITVYEEDTQAYEQWIKEGIIKEHIVKCNRDRNFWDVGNGPCGPCTEIYFDRGEKFDPKKIGERLFFEDMENDRYVEIWNIVFSQFNNNGKNEYTELTRKNIDTGAGLERLACIMQEANTNYDTDLFSPVINVLMKFTKKYKYDPNAYFSNDEKQKNINRNFIVVVDHLKANIFAIADGATITAKERGSVLRKLIRRAIICAYELELEGDFLTPTIEAIIDTMKDFYPYLVGQKSLIINAIVNEQKLFNSTLENGFKLFFESTHNKDHIDGETIFKLTDTFGFPLEVIQNLCNQRHIKFDEKDYENKANEHKQISKSANTNIKAMASQNENLLNFKLPSEFDYDNKELTNAKIIGIFDQDFNPVHHLTASGWVVFDKTCFYATSGGQEHDNGKIYINNLSYDVTNVIKGPNGQHFHYVELNDNSLIDTTMVANLVIDKKRRLALSRNHSAHHLLETALKQLISDSIHQQGSNLTPQRLTMDFNYSSKLSIDQINAVEAKVNEFILAAKDVETKLMTLQEAKESNAIANFENVYKKLNGKLRVLFMKDISVEVCGGTHVHNTKEIEQFMITNFEVKGSGMCRIEAITSNELINNFLTTQINQFKTKIESFKEFVVANKVNDPKFEQLVKTISYDLTVKNYRLISEQFKQLEIIFTQIKKQLEKINNEKAIEEIKTTLSNIKDQTINVYSFTNKPIKTILQSANSIINEHQDKVIIAINEVDNKMQYLIVTGSKLMNNQNYWSNTLIKKINEITQGSGGGSKNFAQGGTANLAKKAELLAFLSKIN